MIETLEYTVVDGENKKHDVKVYALSTCGFCRKGLKYLREKSVKHQYIHIDQLDYEVKQKVKGELKEKFNKRIAFPLLVVDDKEALVGFTESEWKSKIFD